ncbi:GH25 family lysozyme [Bradyrhizobium zhanjiangense]|uniref:GH25 family lysozyme n=1 Tax=Bradyrhizobium zhanjiangense TaxID=1325107 RepID=UPI001008B34D|nr:GH25 family lysozyme [Bradyrhizobium zhanjiangense]
MAKSIIAASALLMIAVFSSTVALGQDDNSDEVNPASLRRFWLGVPAEPQAAAAPYLLTSQEQDRFGGTFGIDLSHWSFDIDNTPANCRTQQRYTDPACSCTINWQEISDNKLLHVYSKATDGSSLDLSFARVWSDLESRHASGKLFRGAFHFLRPGVDPRLQADVFLRAVGAVDGKKPDQLPPALDIEWSNKQILPGTEDFNKCPENRRTQSDQGRHYCDMWYTMQPQDIAAMAKEWIDRVETATGRKVVIYTNPKAWWNPVMDRHGDALLTSRAVWTSRYTSSGPKYNPNWTAEGGSREWKMAPLPRGASYPQNDYTMPHLWQFTESGRLLSNVFTCAGRSEQRDLDMSWVPISGPKFLSVFGVGAR